MAGLGRVCVKVNDSFERWSLIVFGVKGNQARTGINAPKEIAVHRQEI